MLYILVHIMFNWDDQHTVDMKVLYDSYSLNDLKKSFFILK